VDTQVEQAKVHALEMDLNSMLTCINISSTSNFVCFFLYITNSVSQKIIEFSQGKDKIFKASLSWIYEARDLEDELGQERKTNQAL
jgi:hypothetical protein